MNGKEAIDVLTAPDQEIDLILTDIMMPEVDGMELMKIVQSSDKPFKSIPIIVMSTVDSDDFMTKCQEAGAQDYLVKPLKKSQMVDLGKHASVSAGTATTNNNSNASTETGARGISPENNGEATTAVPVPGFNATVAEGGNAARRTRATSHSAATERSMKRSSRIADKRAQQEREAAAAAEAAKQAKAQAQAKAVTKAAAKEAAAKDPEAAAKRRKPLPAKEKGGEGIEGRSEGMEKWASGASDGSGKSQNLSGSGCGSGGSGSGEEPNVEGLSVQLVKAYGGATTMLELSLPRTAANGEEPRVGLRRSASRSAFQSFLNLEDAAAAQVITLKVAPEVAARAEGGMASLAGIAAVAAEGTGTGTEMLADRPKPETQPVASVAQVTQVPPQDANAPSAPPHHMAFSGHVGHPNMGAAVAGMPMPPYMYHIPGMPPPPLGPDGRPLGPPPGANSGAPGGGPQGQPGSYQNAPPPGFPPCPPGIDPALYAQHMAAASAAAAKAGPAGSAAAGPEFVSRFYSVLQSTLKHQQSTFMRLGANATCAERRAEAISRFLKKRKERNFEKKVRYASRKRLAEARPRVRGQFVRLKDEANEGEGSGGDGSAKGEEGSNDGAGSNGGSNNGGSNEGSKENSASPTRREDKEPEEDEEGDH